MLAIFLTLYFRVRHFRVTWICFLFTLDCKHIALHLKLYFRDTNLSFISMYIIFVGSIYISHFILHILNSAYASNHMHIINTSYPSLLSICQYCFDSFLYYSTISVCAVFRVYIFLFVLCFVFIFSCLCCVSCFIFICLFYSIYFDISERVCTS